MATKKTTKKTTTKKTTTKKTSATRSTSSSPAAPARTAPSRTVAPAAPAKTAPSRTVAPAEPTYPRPVPEPVAPATPAAPEEPTVEVRPYKHVGDQAVAFMAEHPDGVYIHLDKVSKKDNEAAIKSLDKKTPVFVDGKTFSVSELKALGFKVFQNGRGGKLIGTRGV